MSASHHDVSEDRLPAYIGLIGGALVALVVLFSVVKLTNAHFAGERGEEGGRAEAASAAEGATRTTAPSTEGTTQGAGTEQQVVAATTPAAVGTAAPAAAPAASGNLHDVQMVGDAKGYRFEPATLTIKAGDTVRWTMASGGPHNVTFWPDSIPAGSADALGKGMSKATAPLTGPLLLAPNEKYEIVFAGAKAGKYAYYCQPHLALGMKAAITVQ